MDALRNDLMKVVEANKNLELEKTKLKEDKKRLIDEVIHPLKEKIKILKQELQQSKAENDGNRLQVKELEDRRNIIDVKEEVLKANQKKWEEEQEYEKLLIDEEWFNIQKANGLEEPNDYELEDFEETKELATPVQEKEILEEIVEKKTSQAPVNEESIVVPPAKKKRGRPSKMVKETPSKKPRIEKTTTPRRSPRLEKQSEEDILPKQEPSLAKTEPKEEDVKEEKIDPIVIPKLDLNTPVTRSGYYLQSQKELDHVQEWMARFGDSLVKVLQRYLKISDKADEYSEEFVIKFFDRLSNNILEIFVENNGNLLDIHLNDFKKVTRYILNNLCIFFPVKSLIRNHILEKHKNIKDADVQELVKNFTDDFVTRIIDSYITISQDKMLLKLELTEDNKTMIKNEIDWFLSLKR